MGKILKIISFVFLILLISACRANKLKTPSFSYTLEESALPVSTFRIPVEMDLLLLEKLINEQFADLLYEDEQVDGKQISIKAWKVKDFKLKFENQAFIYEVPIRLNLKVSWEFNQFGLKIKDEKELEGEVNLHFSSSLSISQDWRLLSETVLLDYEWISKPVLKIGMLNMPITPIVDKLVKLNEETLTEEIDLAVKEHVPLLEYVKEWWLELQEPFEVLEDYPLFLHIRPLSLSSSPLEVKNNKIYLYLLASSYVNTYLGEIPLIKKDSLIPPHQTVHIAEDKSEINMFSLVSYEMVNTLAKENLIGLTFKEGKYQVEIVDVETYVQQEKMIIAVLLTGSYEGFVYFSGIPYYDKKTSSIIFKEFDLDLETKHFLLKSFKWLYQFPLKKIIASKMVFPVEDLLEEMKSNIQPVLSDFEIVENLNMSSELETVMIEEIFLEKEGIKLLTQLKGKIKLQIK